MKKLFALTLALVFSAGILSSCADDTYAEISTQIEHPLGDDANGGGGDPTAPPPPPPPGNQ